MGQKTVDQAVKAVEEILDIEFKNKKLLLQALTHRSYLNENDGHPTGHYERLEFLGDSVMTMLITEELFKKYPDATEGKLTDIRSALESTQTLSEISLALGIPDHIFVSRGEALRFDRNKRSGQYIAGCLIEALIGALYLDQGIGSCRYLVDSLIMVRASKLISEHVDHKGNLQKEAQARWGVAPHYLVTRATGPDHDRAYEISCMILDTHVAIGKGASKNEAQKLAAKTAIETMATWEGRISEVAKQAGSAMRHSGQNGAKR